ncbi:hypothetical protein SK128_006421 [Halocaridina rubra]|uniref:Uncharacterized protein n=1 Tax=Halocaridina rubra TaxID=373956 RepID=A0AAN8WLM1_HALRR
MGASYLSHSLLSLHDAKGNEKSACASGLRSNQLSFSSKGSHFGVGSIRSNAYSFSHRDSHIGLSQYDLHPNQHHYRDSFHNEYGIHSNNQSFCSRKGSQAGVSGLVSNPTSFSIKASQVDLYHQLPHDGEMEKLYDSDPCSGTGKARFMLREGDCDLSCCTEEPEAGTSGHQENLPLV